VNYFARNLDNLLIGKYWGSQQLGVYAKAYQLLMLPLEQINGPIGSVAIPALSRLADSPQRYRSAYLRLLEKIALLTMPLVAFMIGTSDWLVLLFLGPKWAEVGPVFAFLGIAGLVQPILSTAGLLYITQGRTHHMFQFGLIASPIIILSIVCGLPWGATGVALAYSGTFILVMTPLVFWFVGREGPVRSRDLYRTIAPFACASIVALLISLGFRSWSGITKPLIGLVTCFPIAIGGTLLILSLFRVGRSTLVDTVNTILLLIRSWQGRVNRVASA